MIKYFMFVWIILICSFSYGAKTYKIHIVSSIYFDKKSETDIYDLYAIEYDSSANTIKKGAGYSIQLLKKGKKVASQSFDYVEMENLGVAVKGVGTDKNFTRTTMKVDFTIKSNVKPDSVKLFKGKKMLKTVLVKY